MPSVVEEIINWSKSRPLWQSDALRRIFKGESIDDDIIARYADACLGEDTDNLVPITEDDVRTTGEATPVTLRGVSATSNVNALPDGAGLTFGSAGLTIVYGDNGSGKSGFARVLKQAVRARAAETVHTDIFERPAGPPSAQVHYSADEEDRTATWREGVATPGELSRVSFFDGDCGAVYLSRETDAAFRPFGLDSFDALVRVCDEVRAELEQRSTTAGRRTPGLPTLQAGTSAAAFLASVTHTTSTAAIDHACVFDERDDARLSELRTLIAAASIGSASSRAEQVTRLARRVERLVPLLDTLADRVSDSTTALLSSLWSERSSAAVAAAAARELAVQASSLPGIGEAAWRTLWEAARAYSEAVAFPGASFPVTSDAVCVLCQQALGTDAQARLLQFEAFVQDHTQQAADAAASAYDAALGRVAPFADDLATTDTLRDLEAEDPEDAARIGSYLQGCDAWLHQMQGVVSSAAWSDAPDAPAPVVETARAAASRLLAQAESLLQAGDAETLRQLRQEAAELDDRKALHAAQSAVVAERDRLANATALTAARSAASTNSITQKSVDLTNAAITEVLVDRFSRETDRLGLERVVLRSIGGRRGVLRYRTKFVDAVQEVPLPEVLSEGEQTALGLAGFLAEVWTEGSRSAVVFDDPVSSLDHERRDKVAERIAGLAEERQVIVFSHDIAFVRSLKKHADAKGVGVTSRSVERIGSRPGHSSEHHKFSAKLMKERLADLQTRLDQLKADSSQLTPDDYRDKTLRWYSLVRRTWERAIEESLLGTILTRDTLEVHPKMVRVLTAFTVTDNKELQLGYARATEFAELHDESDIENRPAPTLSDMESDLKRLFDWHSRIDARRNLSTEKLEAQAAAANPGP